MKTLALVAILGGYLRMSDISNENLLNFKSLFLSEYQDKLSIKTNFLKVLNLNNYKLSVKKLAEFKTVIDWHNVIGADEVRMSHINAL